MLKICMCCAYRCPSRHRAGGNRCRQGGEWANGQDEYGKQHAGCKANARSLGTKSPASPTTAPGSCGGSHIDIGRLTWRPLYNPFPLSGSSPKSIDN